MVLFGAQGAGALIWGVAAGTAGLVSAFLISAVVMTAGAATLRFWPFHQIAEMDRSLVRWPEPQLLLNPDRGNGLVLVRITYTVAAEKNQQFLQAMARLRQSRLRTGATDWALYQDGQNPRLFIEQFSVPSWEEHLRQHRERQTGTDPARSIDGSKSLAQTSAQTRFTSARGRPTGPRIAVRGVMDARTIWRSCATMSPETLRSARATTCRSKSANVPPWMPRNGVGRTDAR
jgi:Transmembrane secretion effector